MLLMYADGLVEARNGIGEEFGKRGILDFTSSNDHLSSERFIAGLRDAVNAYSGSKRADDMTMMAISRTSKE